MSENKKVVLLCPYSYPSACGIWTRVYEDAKALRDNGYDVSIFSSNVIKGTVQTSSDFEEYDGLKLYRFPVKFSLGGTSMFWSFGKKIKEINPDIIHTHGYRHPHSFFSALGGHFSKKIIFLTTHAPFEKDKRRSIVMKGIDVAYDLFIGWWELKLYKKVIRISDWEKPYLEKLGVKDTILIPNGIKEVFLQQEPKIDDQQFNKIVYLGRIDPVKQPEWLVSAAEKLKDKSFEILGPLSGYDEFKSELPNFSIVIKTYNSEEFINELCKADIYVLPSAREAMPFTLLEAMSQGKFVISSPTNGGKEVIVDGENGFIANNSDELATKIQYIYDNWQNLQFIRYNAIDKAKEYSSTKSNAELIKLYQIF